MQSFKDLLTEAKDRFIDKNKYLTDDQKEELKKFFRDNNKAEKDVEDEFGWQKKSKTMRYDQFQDIMNRYKGGRKAMAKSNNAKCPTKLKGLTAGEDFVHLRLTHKEYCAYIPLNYETAQKFNRDDVIGTCSGSWCVGHSSSRTYWNSHVKKERQVPVYIVGNNKKWIAMIQKDNKSIEVWDLANDRPGKMIPRFNDRKELISGKKSELYDDIRNNFHHPRKRDKISKNDIRIATDAYDQLKDDIERYARVHLDHEEYHNDEMQKILDNTIQDYRDQAQDAQEKARNSAGGGAQYRNYKARSDSFKAILKAEPTGTGKDHRTGEAIWHVRGTEYNKKSKNKRVRNNRPFGDYVANAPTDGMPYTRSELQAFIDTFERDIERKGDSPPDFSDRDDLLAIANELSNTTYWEILEDESAWDHVDFTDEFYEYEGYDGYEGSPNTMDDDYDDYFEFLDDFSYERADREELRYDIEGELHNGNGWDNVDGYGILEYMDLPHPDKIVKDMAN